jgi:beta-lactamase regulating signal transducer with metallopeptidase domain
MNSWIELASKYIQDSHFAVLFLDALLKSFVVLALAAGACALWRRSSAATRHLIWFLAVAGLPCLPLLTSMLPSWQRPLWSVSTGYDSGNRVSLALEFGPGKNSGTSPLNPQTSPGSAEKINAGRDQSEGSHKLSAHFNANWLVFGFVVWGVGVVLVLLSVAFGQIRLHKFSHKARLLRSADWTVLLEEARETLRLRRDVSLLQSSENVMPLTWGWWRPVVLLPADAEHWPIERRRIVLLHELAHVKRWDCLTQIAARVVCAFYWINPLVWLAARRMCVERERACDDLVLNGGCKASDYAGHLVEIAGRFRRVPQVAAIAMARPSGLEQRIAAIVDASRARCLRPLTVLAVLLVMGGIVFSVGGCKTSVTSSRSDESNPLRQQQITRLEAFSALKEKQSRILAAAAGETISPEFQRYFDAAAKGDSRTVTNMYESFKRRHPQYGKKGQHSDMGLRTSYWGPVLEISLAYDHVVRCEPEYTQVAVDDILNSIPAGSIYFGGTDPGRGLPTAFSKSHPDADPFYTLTQNALADGSYLEYLQNTYGERAKLLGRLIEARRSDSELQAWDAKWPVAVRKLDSLEISEDDPQYKAAQETVNDLGQKRDDRTKAILAGLQVRADASTAGRDKKSLYIPTFEDSQKCFQDYIADATQRLHNHQLKPGEDVKEVSNGPGAGNRIQVSGQVAVMAINGLLVKVIFDKNPGHECFIEESFPLDWIYPHLEPHGLIMKINRQPLTDLSEESVRKDQEYWRNRTAGMIGGWLNADTSVQVVAEFAEKVFAQHDLAGFTGDPRFVQNDYACKMFSKLRSSIAGLYAWRAEHATATGEKERLGRAADFAFRQAFALCPYSPEAVDRYANFLRSQNREADAGLVNQTAERLKLKSHDTTATSSRRSVFQIRLVLDAPSDDSEQMPLVYQNGSAASHRPAAVFNVQKTVLLDRSAVESAALTKDQRGSPRIEITLTSNGRKQFADVTREHLHKWLAIVIDGQVWSAPTVASEISGGKAEINGSFSEQEAKVLTAKINEAAGK